MNDSTPPLLRVTQLDKTFTTSGGLSRSSHRALSGVSFDIAEGEVVALVGESGSGKSTVARIIAGLITPDRGSVEFLGRRVLDRKAKATLNYRKQVQLIFQDPFASLNPIHSVRYHLERPLVRHQLAASAAQRAERVSALLDSVGLSPAADFANKFPHELSGGQRQRVAIARALAVSPKLVLADEPTSMLDVSIRVGILNLMLELKAEHQLSYLYVTHDIASARYVADRTMVLYRGHLVEQAPSTELIDRPAHPYSQLLLSSVPDPERPFPARASAAPTSPDASSSTGVGCPFAGRCSWTQAVCRERMPEARDLGGGRWVKCHADLVSAARLTSAPK